MKPLPEHSLQSTHRTRAVGAAYDQAGERYRAYADGDLINLYDFSGQYGFGDHETWGVILQTLHDLRSKGVRHLSVIDLGCGPGTWLRRIIDRARMMGFTSIRARGVDLAEAQVRRARMLARNHSSQSDVHLRFEVGDIRANMPEANDSVDLCLCLYGVLNHLPAEDVPALFREVSRVTSGNFIATMRAIGSVPTIYVESTRSAKTYSQDNARGQLDVEFHDGTRTSFPSHLFSAAEIRAMATQFLHIDDLRGLDLFHGRFAKDPHWNPAEASLDASLLQALRNLERRFDHDPLFIDHATHLLMVSHATGHGICL